MLDQMGNAILTGTFTFHSAGKIGMCAQQHSARLTASTTSLTNLTSFSIAMWVKLSNTASTAWYDLFGFTVKNGDTVDSMRVEVTANGGSNFLVFCNNISGSTGGYAGFSLSKDVWTHLIFIKQNGGVSTYINGVLSNTSILNNFMDTYATGEFHIGDSNFYASYNDVRIYNHVLSQAEIKELSKGLVLHYTFDSAALESTTNLITGLKAGGRTTYNAADKSITTAGLNQDTYFYLKTSEPIVEGRTYTLQCMASGIGDGKQFVFGMQGQSSSHHSFKIVDGYNEYTFQANSYINGLTEILMDDTSRTGWESQAKFYNFQLEIKDHGTLYTPDTRPAALSNNTGIIIGNNVDTANTIYSPDAAIGNGALKCSNTSLQSFISGDITQGVTISCWVKGSVPTDSRVVFADYNSKLAFGFFNNGQAIITCAGYGHKCVTDIKTPWTDDWNHIVVRRDSAGAVKCFLNSSELALSGSQEWSHAAATFSIGCRNNGTWTSYFNGLVDDMRVYHTALSDNDIKELYGSRWATNKVGQVFSNAINEAQAKFQITKGGINNCRTLNESGILPSNFIPLQYIQSSGTQFINTNHLATENTRTIFDYEYLNTSASFAGLFGSDNYPTNYDMGYGVFLNGSTYSCYVSNHTTGGCWNQEVGTWIPNKRTLLDFTHSKLIVDNTVHNLKTTTFATSLVPIYLFSARRSTGNAGTSAIRLYGCQIWEGTTLVRNFIPAKTREDQMVGLYDTVNHKFYINAGSGTFTVGPPAISQLRDGSLYCAEFNEI
jgi:hypothetical protein